MNRSILVVGDSWASAREADTGLDRGWPFYMSLPSEACQGISGSKAVDWASDRGGCLSRAISFSTHVDTVILSLFGNDARHFADDGQITVFEVVEAIKSMRQVVCAFSHVRHLVLLAYTDPYFGRDPKSAIGVRVINSAVRLSALACRNASVFNTAINRLPEHFDGVDFHLTSSGHKALAIDLASYVSSL